MVFTNGMLSILVSKIKEKKLTATSHAYGNSHRRVNLERFSMS